MASVTIQILKKIEIIWCNKTVEFSFTATMYRSELRATPLPDSEIVSNDMATAVRMPSANQPKSMTRPTRWNEEVEEAYRFQIAGYRDEIEYREVQKTDHVDRWPHNGYVKKLVRRDGCFYYYNRTRECPDKQINKTKLYEY